MTAELEIYDRSLMSLRRDRAARKSADSRFLLCHVDDDMIERLDFVQRRFERALIVGAADSRLPGWLAAKGTLIECCDSGRVFAARQLNATLLEPDRLAGLHGGYDLVIAPGGMDMVNDLPGMLVQCRRLMTDNAMFMGAMAGAGSLPLLRQALQQAEQAEGRGASPRLHPQIDVRAAGDLLSRAGFVEPVADSFGLQLSYRTPEHLIEDLRVHAAGNALIRRDSRAFGKKGYRALRDALKSKADEQGRFHERIDIVTMTAWTPVKAVQG